MSPTRRWPFDASPVIRPTRGTPQNHGAESAIHRMKRPRCLPKPALAKVFLSTTRIPTISLPGLPPVAEAMIRWASTNQPSPDRKTRPVSLSSARITVEPTLKQTLPSLSPEMRSQTASASSLESKSADSATAAKTATTTATPITTSMMNATVRRPKIAVGSLGGVEAGRFTGPMLAHRR